MKKKGYCSSLPPSYHPITYLSLSAPIPIFLLLHPCFKQSHNSVASNASPGDRPKSNCDNLRPLKSILNSSSQITLRVYNSTNHSTNRTLHLETLHLEIMLCIQKPTNKDTHSLILNNVLQGIHIRAVQATSFVIFVKKILFLNV